MSTATADHTAEATDAAVIDAIAWRLASSADWSADELTDIADLIGTASPHPAAPAPTPTTSSAPRSSTATTTA